MARMRGSAPGNAIELYREALQAVNCTLRGGSPDLRWRFERHIEGRLSIDRAKRAGFPDAEAARP